MSLNIPELIAHPEKLADRAVLNELRELMDEYPYFQSIRLLYIKGLYLLRDASFGEELRRAALFVPDRKVLFNQIEGEYYTLRPVVRKAKHQVADESAPVDRTQVLIDAFLNGLPPEPEEETPLLPIDDGGLSADYTAYILREEELSDEEEDATDDMTPMKGQQLIDDFIKNSDNNTPAEVKEEPIPVVEQEMEKLPEIDEDDGYFTETLAKIYIKQQRYGKALEIIRRLSLKYPKKNAYFADQIRFLEKLIINSNDK
ncbi:MAG: tetratricopeptide repeat protein [Bacteroidaceae bacterium]|nr:tetratricopeptide repeat protein [Bacteroidaceae bacterium]MBR3895922.1 tetratricopeptide repeat protein [Bacteroidaceae bacterium]